MQRCCSRLCPFALSAVGNRSLSSSPRRLISSSPPRFREPVPFLANGSVFDPLSCPLPRTQLHLGGLGFLSPPVTCFQMTQTRDFAAKDRSRAPTTPVTSKLKKYKIKAYSSFKLRFRTMNDGLIRRWRAGKRHNAHLKSKKSIRRLRKPEIVHAAYAKSKKSIRRLRKPEIVHAAYAKVMKKLNFSG